MDGWIIDGRMNGWMHGSMIYGKRKSRGREKWIDRRVDGW